MRHLFAFIIKNYFFFLFLLLEAIALSMIIGNNYQRTIVMNSSNRFTGGINDTYHSITEFFSLKKANQELVIENEKFRNSNSASFLVRDTSVYFSVDSLFRYISSEVISASISKQKNYLMINKGSQHGIELDMGVVSPKGIVGTVIEVSQNYSVVMPAINIRNKINGRIKKNNHTGTIEWDGQNYREGLITDIPTHVELLEGDSIITSGYSHIFPAGIDIGTVVAYYTNEGDKFNSARIQFSVDFNNLNYVYVIKNMMLEEQLLLEKEVGDE